MKTSNTGNQDNRLGKCVLGQHFKNPIILASGTAGFGRELAEVYAQHGRSLSEVGGIVSKGITLEKRLGNNTPRIAETPSGMLNSIGLQNPGVDAFIRDEADFFTSQGTISIANICGFSENEYVEVAKRLSKTSVDLLELNISCPNVSKDLQSAGKPPIIAQDAALTEDIVRKVKAVCRQPLIVKLSPNVTNIVDIALAAERGGADAISLINTFTGTAIDFEKREFVLDNRIGGVSGPAIKPMALRMTVDVAKAINGRIPIIGMGGISNWRDVFEFMVGGASLVQVGTKNLTDPMAIPRMIDDMQNYFAQNNINSTDEIIGTCR